MTNFLKDPLHMVMHIRCMYSHDILFTENNKKIQFLSGMTALGAGLAGFFLGIIAADGFATIGAGLGLNGESLKTLMGNFFGAFTQAGLTGVAVLGAILAAGAGVAGLDISPLKIVKGMTAVGAGGS